MTLPKWTWRGCVIGGFIGAVIGLVWASQVNAQEPVVPVEPTAVKVTVDRPPQRVENVNRFKPEATPTQTEVRQIAAFEQDRWGGPSIIGRIWCESTGNWAATNGPYRGLLQIGPWWNYAWPRTPRGVRDVKKRRVNKPIIEITTWSDGSVTRKKIGIVRQKRVRIKKGKLPGGASPYHGWAAIRVGQRAVSGDGPSTAWACGYRDELHIHLGGNVRGH